MGDLHKIMPNQRKIFKFLKKNTEKSAFLFDLIDNIRYNRVCENKIGICYFRITLSTTQKGVLIQ